MSEVLEKRIARLVQAVYPGVCEFQLVSTTARLDIKVPHGLGRPPDYVEILDAGILALYLDAVGVTVPTASVGHAVLLDTTDLEVVAITPQTLRPEGSPLTHLHKTSSLYVIIRNWWTNPSDEDTNRYLLVVMGVRQGEIGPVDNASDLVGAKILEIVANPSGGVHALAVAFSPANLNWMTDKEFQGMAWTWDFGDGTPTVFSALPFATHIFADAGVYDVTLSGKTPTQGNVLLHVTVTVT